MSKKLSRRRQHGLLALTACAIFLIVTGSAIFLRARSFEAGPMPAPLAAAGLLPVTFPDGHRGLLGDLARKDVPTVISLWASWCVPCRREAPKIADLRRRYKSRLNVIYLNVRDADSSPAERARYMVEAGMDSQGYAVLSDNQIRSLTRAADNLIPRTLLFDRRGEPIAAIKGYKPLALARIDGFVSR